MNVCPGSTATFKAVYSAKENKEAGPGQVGRPAGVCQAAGAAASSGTSHRPAFPPSGRAEPCFP